MLRFPESSTVQEYSCSVIWGGSDEVIATMASAMAIKDKDFHIFDPLDAIIRAIILFPDHLPGVSDATNALWNFSQFGRLAHYSWRKGAFEVLFDTFDRHFDKIFTKGNELAIDYLVDDCLPALRVITYNGRHYDPELGFEMSDDDEANTKGFWRDLGMSVFTFFKDKLKLLMAREPQAEKGELGPEAVKAMARVICELTDGMCTMFTEEYLFPRTSPSDLFSLQEALELSSKAYYFTKQYAHDRYIEYASDVSSFFCDLLRVPSNSKKLLDSAQRLLLDMIQNLDDNAKEMEERDYSPPIPEEMDADEADKPEEERWRHVEFYGYVVDKLLEEHPHDPFWSKETVLRLLPSVTRSVKACMKHRYVLGVNFALPLLHRLVTRFDPAYGDLLRQFRANKEFIEALKSFEKGLSEVTVDPPHFLEVTMEKVKATLMIQ